MNCIREDLQIVINVPTYWGVNDDGTRNYEDHRDDGDANDDVARFHSYYCSKCDTYFPKKEGNCDAWADALAHIRADNPDAISITWMIDDVHEVAPDLNLEQQRQVLVLAKKHHDANIGINWEVLDTIADLVRREADASPGLRSRDQ